MSNEHITDEQIREALEAEFLGEPGKRNWDDDLRVARATLALRSAAQPVNEPVAAMVRYRHLSTPARIAVDGRDHYGEWSEWEPQTLAYARAVTDPVRNAGPLYEMKLLYTAEPSTQTWDANQIAMACAQAEISDGHCQSLLIQLEESNKE